MAVAAALALVWLLVELTSGASDEPRPSPTARPLESSQVADLELVDDERETSSPSDQVEKSATTNIEAETAQTLRAVQPPSSRAIVVWGSLVDSSNEPLILDRRGREGRILFEGPDDRRRFADSRGDGRYRIENLRPGSWSITADIRGHQLWKGSIILLEGDLERQFDIVLQQCPKLLVRIEADRRPMAFEVDPKFTYQRGLDTEMGWEELRPIVTKDPPPRTLPPAFRERVGKVVARNEDSSVRESGTGRFAEETEFEIHDSLPVYVSAVIGDRVQKTQFVEFENKKVVFEFTRQECDAVLGSLRFKVVDENGVTPKEAVRCWIHRDASVDSNNTIPLFGSGEFLLQRLLPGPIGIEIVVSGYASICFETQVEPGRDRNLGEIPLRAGTFIRGRIFSPDDSLMSFEAARVECIPLSGARLPAIFHIESHKTSGT